MQLCVNPLTARLLQKKRHFSHGHWILAPFCSISRVTTKYPFAASKLNFYSISEVFLRI